MSKIFPVITLPQPWATWIIRGWKTIETRTHPRLAFLNRKTILIHAGLHTDASEAAMFNKYLTESELKLDPLEMVNGFIIGSAFVSGFGQLNEEHSDAALIDCKEIRRWGLFLTDITRISPIPASEER